MLGITGYYIDYTIITIAANNGVTHMTKEHLLLSVTLQIPFIVIITKIDIAPSNIYEQTKIEIIKYIKTISKLKPFYINDDTRSNIKFNENYPVLSVSSKTGENIDILRKFIYNLKFRESWKKKLI